MQKLERSGRSDFARPAGRVVTHVSGIDLRRRSAFARYASFGETAFAYRMLALGYVAARSEGRESAFARCASFGETAFAYRTLASRYVAARSAAT
jgi:hypothetical protein